MLVRLQTGEQLHYLDWPAADSGAPIVLLHGLARTAWTWLPVARRLASDHPVVAPDLRGHGASDAPLHGYDLESMALDMLTVVAAKGWGAAAGGVPVVVVGHGLGAMIAVEMARLEPESVASLVLVDGGLEETAEATRMSSDELLAQIEAPEDVMASMDAYLEDRRSFDPASWDADQELAARAQVTEKRAGHVRSVTKASAMRRTIESMYAYKPLEALVRVRCPLLVLLASSGAADDDEQRERDLALEDVMQARAREGLSVARIQRYDGVGHDLMRYRPDEVSAAIAELASTGE
jgi:pimeloyl-ACP methyl ester carboxylesterase